MIRSAIVKAALGGLLPLCVARAANAAYLNVDATVDFAAEYFVVTQQDSFGNPVDTVYLVPAVQHGLQHFQFSPISS